MDMDRTLLRVADVMTNDPICVDVDASLEEVDHLLRSTLTTGLPVVDGNGALVGVISQADLVLYRFAPRLSS
jgi:MFS transporter, DHA2 family, multidrug resistance protein